MIRGQDTARARSSGGRGGEAVSAGAAAPATRPVQDGPSAGPQDWAPRRRARGVCPAGSDGRRSRIGRPEISEGAGGRLGDAGRLSCRVCGEHPVAAFLGDLVRAQVRSWRLACRPPHRKHQYADPLVPASPAGELRAGLLCTTMWITCVKRRQSCAHIGEMLGIVLPGRALTGLSPGKVRPAPCAWKRNRNCPHAAPQ